MGVLPQHEPSLAVEHKNNAVRKDEEFASTELAVKRDTSVASIPTREIVREQRNVRSHSK